MIVALLAGFFAGFAFWLGLGYLTQNFLDSSYIAIGLGFVTALLSQIALRLNQVVAILKTEGK